MKIIKGQCPSLKQFYYLGARVWNNLPSDLRKIDNHKLFTQDYKLQLLHSIYRDKKYVTNNSFDHFYKII